MEVINSDIEITSEMRKDAENQINELNLLDYLLRYIKYILTNFLFYKN